MGGIGFNGPLLVKLPHGCWGWAGGFNNSMAGGAPRYPVFFYFISVFYDFAKVAVYGKIAR
jgi:hypothetical protein